MIQLSNARIKLVIAGRRFGKSIFAINECLDQAFMRDNAKIWYVAPLYRQVKEIAWKLLLEYSPEELVLKKNESELKMTYINGSEICLKGADNPDTLLGVGLNYVVLDESAMMKEEVWYKICRPMLVDTKGQALFISTPRGYNWLYELWKRAETDPEFDRFHFKTTDNTAVEGIREEVLKAQNEATSDLDKIVFRQEYEAIFETVVGRPRFDLDLLTKMRQNTKPIIDRYNNIDVYERPDPTCRYVAGIDTSEGLITGDNSTCVIINCKTFKVSAKYKGIISPDKLAHYIKDWCTYYNEALAVVEDNNHGLVTLNFLKEIYKNIYYRKVKDEIADTWSKKIGWRTSIRTKPMLIANIDKALRDGLIIYDADIIQELMTYVIEEDGKTNAQEGSNDDLVIGLGLAIQGYTETLGHIELPKPEPKMHTPAWIMKQKKLKEKKSRYSHV